MAVSRVNPPGVTQAGVPLLFWTCANEVTPIKQAKRFYPLFAMLGNLAPIASGQTMAYVSRHRSVGLDPDMAFEQTLKASFSCVFMGSNSLAGAEHSARGREWRP